ncbi:MAG TPA: porin family protein [Bacteroidales bacterium]|nr:porin family protein [Bacteroidales bacterium]
MKKIIVCIIATVLSGSIFAQKVSGGLFFGPTMSWMGTDSKTIDPDGMKFGYNFGALIDLNLIDNFAISTGIQFNKLGGNLNYVYTANKIITSEGDTVLNAGKTSYNLNYLAIPFGFKGKTNEIGYLTYFLKAGVTPLINIKTLGTIGTLEDVLLDEINLFNMGWHIGGGAEYSLSGNTRILFEIMYTGGLFDVDKTTVYSNEGHTAETNPKVTLSDIHLKVGILF